MSRPALILLFGGILLAAACSVLAVVARSHRQSTVASLAALGIFIGFTLTVLGITVAVLGP